MGFRNTPSHYGSIAKFLHWLILILIFIMIPIGLFWSTTGAVKDAIINLHKLMGLSILGLTILRLIWAMINPLPKLTDAVIYERIIEYSMYGALYLFMFAIPLTGWIMTTASGKPPHLFGIALPMPGIHRSESLAATTLEIHGVFAGIFVAIIIIHILSKMKNGCRWQ